MPLHTFKKAETVEEVNGLSRKTDDEDELGEHSEALDQLDMRNARRSAGRPRPIYQSDLILEGPSLQMKDGAPPCGLPYPEWD